MILICNDIISALKVGTYNKKPATPLGIAGYKYTLKLFKPDR